MKKKSYIFIVMLLAFFAIVFPSCGESDKRIVDKLYKEREYLLKEFKNKSIITRGKTLFQLSYYQGGSVNTFFFEKKNNVLTFTNDTLQYPINEIAAFGSVKSADSIYDINALCNELNRLLKILNRLKINNVSAEFASAGIDMKIYFGNYKALLYVSDTTLVRNARWKSYLNSGEKLDANWYYVKDEK